MIYSKCKNIVHLGLVTIDATVNPPRVKFPGKPETPLYAKGKVRDCVDSLLEMGYGVEWEFLF